MTIDGERQQCEGVGQVNVSTQDGISVRIDVLVVKFIPLNFDAILGMNGFAAVGGMTAKSSSDLQLRPKSERGAVLGGESALPLKIKVVEKDFVVSYEDNAKAWTM